MSSRSRRQKQKHCILYSLPYNKKIYSLIIVDKQAERPKHVVVKTSYAETPLSNINIKICVCILLILVTLSTQRGCLT